MYGIFLSLLTICTVEATFNLLASMNFYPYILNLLSDLDDIKLFVNFMKVGKGKAAHF